MPNKTRDELFEENIEQRQALDAIADLVTDDELSEAEKLDAIEDELGEEEEEEEEEEE